MPQQKFQDMMAASAEGGYAVGYFESWDSESLRAVADAAVAMQSPVILGFSGIYLPAAEQQRRERLRVYANWGAALCRSLPVPACLLFNESPYWDWVLEAGRVGFDLVMYSDETLSADEQRSKVGQLVEYAHANAAAVEGEMTALAGVSGDLTAPPTDLRLTDPAAAREFVESTGVDALAVNVGQVHVHGRRHVRLDLQRIEQLHQTITVPMVLHGATSVAEEDFAPAIRLGVRKINVGSALKKAYFEALRGACGAVPAEYNPYEVVGSGAASDVTAAARRTMQNEVERYMELFGSAGKAA